MTYTLRFPPGVIDKDVQTAIETSGAHFVYHEAGAIITAAHDQLRILWLNLKTAAKNAEARPDDRRAILFAMQMIKTQVEQG